MAMKKGRAVSVKERPIYDHLHDLFLRGSIHGFWANEPDAWEIQHAPDAPVIPHTFEQIKDRLRFMYPNDCPWDTTATKAKPRVSRSDIDQFLVSLLVGENVITAELRGRALRMLGYDPTAEETAA